MAALERFHAGLGRRLGDRLSTELRAPVEVKLAFAEVLRYQDFVYSLGQTSCLAVLRLDPPGAQCCLDLSLPLAYRVVGRLLGGAAGWPGEPLAPTRPLTRIEQGLVLPVIETIAAELASAYEPAAAGPVAVREEALESAPADVRIMPGDEQVMAVRFDVTIGRDGGRLSLCLPAPVTDLLCDPAAQFTGPLSRAAREAQRQDVARNLLDAAVELRVVLAETRLRLSDVLTLNEGDIITTNRAAASDLPLEVQERPTFSGQPGQFAGNRAIALTGSVAAGTAVPAGPGADAAASGGAGTPRASRAPGESEGSDRRDRESRS
jgi:flagellar motor switch protein FliM